jgi:GDP/UDP-N,N'-diacetylbacillosamine 2-epimerase (hydrolysing)
MKKICIVTGTRAEYGLLYWLIKGVDEDPELELQLIVTGMHLSPEFGLTWSQINEDGFLIARKIEMLLSSDTGIGISKSMGLAQISFAEAYDQLNPDIVLLLGDRTEIFSAACAALISGLTIAHIGGGESTEGAYDDAIRHSITKMSHLHFTSAEIYRQRVIQMGEQVDSVYNVGAIGLDSIKKLKLLTKVELEKSIKHKLSKRNLLITFHPVTLENDTAKLQFKALLEALDALNETLLIFTKPNSDKNGRIIIQMIDKYVQQNPQKAIAFTSLGQLRYLSAIPFMNMVVGNSSSGIMEVPIFNIPTVNIGDRQKGRIEGPTIFSCSPEKYDIFNSIEKAFLYNKAIQWDHPYGDGNTSKQILDIIKSSTGKIKIKKKFYTLPT